MKLISMLLALLIVGYLVLQQVNKPAATDAVDAASHAEAEPPKVPTQPQDVQAFKQDINQFMHDSKARRDEQMGQAE